MKIHKPELVLYNNSILGEGPCWDEENEVLYWTDIKSSRISVYEPKLGQNKSIAIGMDVGAVVKKADGDLLLAAKDGFFSLNLKSEKLTKISDPEEDIPTNRFNDGKCDRSGRFWAGTMRDDENGLAQGSLYSLETNLTVKKHLSDIAISNGLDWSLDNKTMYYIDSPVNEVWAFDFDIDKGEISNKRTIIKIEKGFPDGMTIDSEGMLWVAQWGGWQVGRYNPETGELLEIVEVPAARASSCAFGGKNMDTLYITTAKGEDNAENPLGGGLFSVKPGVCGVKTSVFNG